MKIFVAGATGAIGRRLLPLLVAAGHDVAGTTRVAAKGDLVRTLGATPVIVNVFDREALAAAVAAARPDVVIHQLTDLAGRDFAGNTPASALRAPGICSTRRKQLVSAASSLRALRSPTRPALARRGRMNRSTLTRQTPGGRRL